MSREVVTLQFGHYSNYVGTHWWNIQESSFIYEPTPAEIEAKEVNHDVMFTEGQTLKGEVTYTPRLVLFDLKGSLNTLKQDGRLYDITDQEESLMWMGDITLHKEDLPERNEFLRDLERQEQVYLQGQAEKENSPQDESEKLDRMSDDSEKQSEDVFGPKLYNLDKSVNVWSDFLHLHLHPKTVTIVNQYNHKDEHMPFDVYGAGHLLMKEDESLKQEVEDKLHFWTEECDHLQGFHILMDTYNGFGGMAASVLQDLEDDFANKGLISFGLSPPIFETDSHQEHLQRLLCTVLSFDKISEHSSLFVPLNLNSTPWDKQSRVVEFPHLIYDASLHYHSSAILATSLDTMTMPYRKQNLPVSIRTITDGLSVLNRKIGVLQTSLPFALRDDGSLVDSLLMYGNESPWVSLTPYTKTEKPFSQSVVLRGVKQDRLKSRLNTQIPRILQNATSLDEVLPLYLTEMFPSSLNAFCSLKPAAKVTTPYPHIFDEHVNKGGELSQFSRSHDVGVESVPVLTSLQCSSSTQCLLQNLNKQTAKINIAKFHKFLECGLEQDDYKEILNNLENLAQAYSTHD